MAYYSSNSTQVVVQTVQLSGAQHISQNIYIRVGCTGWGCLCVAVVLCAAPNSLVDVVARTQHMHICIVHN